MTPLLKKLLTHALGTRRIHALEALMRASAIHRQRPALCRPETGRIVVLAPHMDDEVLGCGGTIAEHVMAGAEVSVVFLTDGRHGGAIDPRLNDAGRKRLQRDLVAVRKQEARNAATILGVKSILFLDAEDGRLSTDMLLPARLRAILDRERPRIVYLPFLLENHADHVATSAVLVAAAAGAGHAFECRCYEVWTPLFPNIVVAIDAVIELKKRALGCYQSQLKTMDYVHTGMGLNAYRSSSIGCDTARFVEAFYALPLAEYRRLHRALSRLL